MSQSSIRKQSRFLRIKNVLPNLLSTPKVASSTPSMTPPSLKSLTLYYTPLLTNCQGSLYDFMITTLSPTREFLTRVRDDEESHSSARLLSIRQSLPFTDRRHRRRQMGKISSKCALRMVFSFHLVRWRWLVESYRYLIQTTSFTASADTHRVVPQQGGKLLSGNANQRPS